MDRMREYGNFPKDQTNEELEAQLRQALDRAAINPGRFFLASCRPNQRVVRIDIPSRSVFYAVLQKPSTEMRDYDWQVPTVISVRMYQSWNEEGKLSLIGEHIDKTKLPKIKEQLCVRWSNGTKTDHWAEYLADDVPEAIRKLIAEGIRRETIKVYKEIPFKVNVSLEGFTS
jgi:hypothetical protein